MCTWLGIHKQMCVQYGFNVHRHFAAGCEGEVVVSGGNDGAVVLWRWQGGGHQRVAHGAKINCCAAVAQGEGVLCCVGDVGHNVTVGVVRF